MWRVKTSLLCLEEKRQNLAHMKTTTLPLKYSMNRAPCRFALLLIPLALVCFALSPRAQATCQQGCLTNQNTVLGDNALLNNTGANNTAIGSIALSLNTNGSSNTANGSGTLFFNTIGSENTANGAFALNQNTIGSDNVANGVDALFMNTTGFANTANGAFALNQNTTGDDNTANGVGTLQNNTTGSGNIALGDSAGINLTTGNNNIDIGNRGVAGDSKTIRIGKQGSQRSTFIGGISGATVPAGVTVIVDANGHLGTTTSSACCKEAIKPMDKASEAILALEPVIFRYKHELDPQAITQFGLVAEQVEKVNPDLVARDDQGKPYTVRYEAVNAMLLNEFLKEHKKVEQQETTIAQLEKELQATTTRQQKQIEALTAGVQRVSAQLELSKSAPGTASNNH
jgi:hypothetical protein